MKRDIRIVVLQAGWVAVGLWHGGDVCKLTDAYIIRQWGTTAGLGEIALNGPTANTVLDHAGVIKYHSLSHVMEIECIPEKWEKYI